MISPGRLLKWKLILVLIFTASLSFANSISDSLLRISKSSSDKKVLAEVYAQLSTIYTASANYDSATQFLNKSFEYYNSLKDERRIVDCYLQFGIIESYRGDYPHSANYLLRCLLYAEKYKDTSVLYAVCINLTSVYSALEDYKKANYYLSKINKADLSKDINLRVNYLGNKGQIEFELGNYALALKNLEEGISLFDRNTPDLNLIQLLILTGDCAIKLNEIPKAKDYYSDALRLTKLGVFPVQLAHTYSGLAKVYQSSDPKLSLEFSQKSIDLAVKYEVLDLVVINHKLRSDIYTSLGNSNLAFNEYKLYDIALDSLNSIDTKESISLLEANYKVEKSNSEIEKLTLINEKNALEKSTYLLITIATFLVILLLIYTLRKRNFLNKKLNKSNVVKDKLLSIIAHDLKSPLHNIISVLNEIDNNTFSKEDQTKIIKDLTNQTDVTLETLENLLKWGQAQLKGVEVNTKSFELRNEINRTSELFKAQLLSKNITINVEIPETINIKYDKDHFDFIMRNILANAIKFSFPNTQISIFTEKVDHSEIKLSIQDFGIGIPYTDKDSIFQPSPKVRLGTNNEKGSGLALSLCKEFSEANGSIIGFDSSENKGTCFYLIIKN